MASWNWGAIFDSRLPGQSSVTDNLLDCYHGLHNGLTFGVVGKTLLGMALDLADLVKFTPAGAGYSVIGGCVINLFHN